MPSAKPRLPSSSINNRILNALPADELERIRPRLEKVALVTKTVLIAPDRDVESVHFVESGVVSMVSTLEDGARIEVGMVGFEGMVGLPVLLGSGTSPWEAMVQIDGSALRMSAAAFRSTLAEVPSLMGTLLRYLDAVQSQVAQSAACNGRHPVEQRLARWLLTTLDRVGGDSFVMTQEFMSTMLGVRRPGVTLAVGALQRAGLVRHERGTMHVLDRTGLEASSCECHDIVKRRYAWLMDD
ncbi:MAG: Crp/Fnr family transcriptional regulator [Acetobacteraceae bacterium]|nr:Crp/Fnr family transcriptional regulator [Acetobacteraceae bacterium]